MRAAADGADILVATGRKWLRGTRGTGFLVLRGAAAELAPPLVGQFSHRVEGDRLVRARGARAFERHEVNVAALLGLGVALRELLDAGPAAVAGRVAAVSRPTCATASAPCPACAWPTHRRRRRASSR